MANLSRKVAQELERTIREVHSAVQDYDDSWHKLKEFNTKHSEVIGIYGGDGIRGSQLITQRAGRKSQTIITNTSGVVEGIDIKHIGDNRVRIENALVATLRRLHRLRDELIEVLGHYDLRSQEQEVLRMKKQIEMRYRRGKSFYLCGSTSEFCREDDENMGKPVQIETWLQESIRKMKEQNEGFSHMIDDFSAQINSKAIAGDDDLIGIEMLGDKIAQHEAMIETHNLHIERLECILRAQRNGSLPEYGGDASAIMDALDPYINANEQLTIIVHDEIYSDFDLSLFMKNVSCSNIGSNTDTSKKDKANCQKASIPEEHKINTSPGKDSFKRVPIPQKGSSSTVTSPAIKRRSESLITDGHPSHVKSMNKVSPAKDYVTTTTTSIITAANHKANSNISTNNNSSSNSNTSTAVHRNSSHNRTQNNSNNSSNNMESSRIEGGSSPPSTTLTVRNHPVSISKNMSKPAIGVSNRINHNTNGGGGYQLSSPSMRRSSDISYPLPAVPSQPMILPDPAKKRRLNLLKMQQGLMPGSHSHGDTSHNHNNNISRNNHSTPTSIPKGPQSHNNSNTPTDISRTTSTAAAGQFRLTNQAKIVSLNPAPLPALTNCEAPPITTVAATNISKSNSNQIYQSSNNTPAVHNKTRSVPTLRAGADSGRGSVKRNVPNYSRPCISSNATNDNRSSKTWLSPPQVPWANSDLAICHGLRSLRDLNTEEMSVNGRRQWWSVFLLQSLADSESQNMIQLLRDVAGSLNSFYGSTRDSRSKTVPVKDLPIQIDIIYCDIIVKAKVNGKSVQLRKGDIVVKFYEDCSDRNMMLGLAVPQIARHKGGTIYEPCIDGTISCSIPKHALCGSVVECLQGNKDVGNKQNSNSKGEKSSSTSGGVSPIILCPQAKEILHDLEKGEWSQLVGEQIIKTDFMTVDWDYKGIFLNGEPMVILSQYTRLRPLIQRCGWVLVEIEFELMGASKSVNNNNSSSSVGGGGVSISGGGSGSNRNMNGSSRKGEKMNIKGKVGWVPDYLLRNPGSVLNAFAQSLRHKIGTADHLILEPRFASLRSRWYKEDMTTMKRFGLTGGGMDQQNYKFSS